MKIIPRSAFLVVLTFITLSLYPKASCGSPDFFSPERLKLNVEVVMRLPSDGKLQLDIKKFAVSFNEGVNALSSGRISEAEKKLIIARDIWPEYYGTDFLLALVYEDKRDYDKAARYYKSYLNKLRSLHAGQYRISAPLIWSLSTFDVEDYNRAHGLVRERLKYYNIDVGDVRPIITPPGFLFPSLMLVIVVCGWLLWRRRLQPYLRKRHEIQNPPEGFWVCRACGTYTPDLAMECDKCRKPRP